MSLSAGLYERYMAGAATYSLTRTSYVRTSHCRACIASRPRPRRRKNHGNTRLARRLETSECLFGFDATIFRHVTTSTEHPGTDLIRHESLYSVIHLQFQSCVSSIRGGEGNATITRTVDDHFSQKKQVRMRKAGTGPVLIPACRPYAKSVSYLGTDFIDAQSSTEYELPSTIQHFV